MYRLVHIERLSNPEFDHKDLFMGTAMPGYWLSLQPQSCLCASFSSNRCRRGSNPGWLRSQRKWVTKRKDLRKYVAPFDVSLGGILGVSVIQYHLSFCSPHTRWQQQVPTHVGCPAKTSPSNPESQPLHQSSWRRLMHQEKQKQQDML